MELNDLQKYINFYKVYHNAILHVSSKSSLICNMILYLVILCPAQCSSWTLRRPMENNSLCFLVLHFSCISAVNTSRSFVSPPAAQCHCSCHGCCWLSYITANATFCLDAALIKLIYSEHVSALYCGYDSCHIMHSVV